MKNDEYFVDFSGEKDIMVILSALFGSYTQYKGYEINLQPKKRKGGKKNESRAGKRTVQK